MNLDAVGRLIYQDVAKVILNRSLRIGAEIWFG